MQAPYSTVMLSRGRRINMQQKHANIYRKNTSCKQRDGLYYLQHFGNFVCLSNHDIKAPESFCIFKLSLLKAELI